MAKPLFLEVQRFQQKWLLWPLGAANILAFGAAVSEPWWPITQENAPPNWSLWFLFFTVLLVTLFLLFTRLETRIDQQGVSVKMAPLHRKPRLYRWSDIASAHVRTYQPLVEYGGWGWRYSLSGAGIAFNISGNQGLQLVLQSGKKILIGTQDPQTLKDVLEYYHPAK